MAEGVPEWFREVVAEGIARLYVLRLDSAPAADTLDGVELVWVEALWTCGKDWVEEDAWRLRRAFVALSQRATRWPAPAQLLEQLPARTPRRHLPPPPLSDEEVERNRARLRQILRDVTQGLQMPREESDESGA